MSKRLVNAALLITLLSLIVKFSGFIRESIMSRQFGASAETDGYLLSFTFITLVIAMVSHGFNNAFLPLYIKDQKKGNKPDANASGVINTLFLGFLALSAICYIFAEQIILFIFAQTTPETAKNAIDATRIFSLFLSTVALNGMFESFLQAKRIFVPPQISRLSATLMSALFALLFNEQFGVLSLAYGFVVGNLLGMVLQGIILWRSNFKWQPTLKMESGFQKEFYILLLPAMLNAIVGQVNLFVNKIFASGTTEGAVTYLNNSSLIVNIPGQIFATTIAVIIFTLLSEQTDDIKKFQKTIYQGLEISLVSLVPIAAGLLVVGKPVIALIYEGGAFTPEDTQNTFMAMLMYLPLIITQGMQFIVAKSMYALGKTSVILRISVTTIILNIILNALLVKPFGYTGLALAASIVSFYYFSMSTIFLYRNIEKGELLKVFYLMFRVGFSSLIMIGPLILLHHFTGISNTAPIIQLLVYVPLGVIVYVAATYFVNRPSFNSVISTLKKR